MKNNVEPLALSGDRAKKIVAKLAEDSSKVFFSKHAEEMLAKRKITRTQVLKCLRCGYISEGPFMNDNDNWQMTFETVSAGDPITAVAALEKNGKGEFILVIIITTY